MIFALFYVRFTLIMFNFASVAWSCEDFEYSNEYRFIPYCWLTRQKSWLNLFHHCFSFLALSRGSDDGGKTQLPRAKFEFDKIHLNFSSWLVQTVRKLSCIRRSLMIIYFCTKTRAPSLSCSSFINSMGFLHPNIDMTTTKTSLFFSPQQRYESSLCCFFYNLWGHRRRLSEHMHTFVTFEF